MLRLAGWRKSGTYMFYVNIWKITHSLTSLTHSLRSASHFSPIIWCTNTQHCISTDIGYLTTWCQVKNYLHGNFAKLKFTKQYGFSNTVACQWQPDILSLITYLLTYLFCYFSSSFLFFFCCCSSSSFFLFFVFVCWFSQPVLLEITPGQFS